MDWLLIIGIISFVVIILGFSILEKDNEKYLKNNEDAEDYNQVEKEYFDNPFEITKDEIMSKAKLGVTYLSDRQRKNLLSKRKKSLLIKNILISSLFIAFSILFLILYLKNKKITLIILFILSILTSIFFIGLLIYKLKKPEDILLYQQLKIDIKQNYENMNSRVVEFEPYVKEYSKPYHNIINLNKKYNFDYEICKQHEYYETLNSKRQFDNFDYIKWFNFNYKLYKNIFDDFKDVYENNKELYKKYLKELETFKKTTSGLDYKELDIDLDYETFNLIEKELYKREKYQKIIEPSIVINYSYVSPSGRNRYSDKVKINLNGILKLINNCKSEEELKAKEKVEKEEKSRIKKEKEKKLRELNKIEKQLKEKELELELKTKEFEEATKGHIYYTRQENEDNKVIEEISNNEMTLSDKLDRLKQKLDNGEISYEDYKNQREKLLED